MISILNFNSIIWTVLENGIACIRTDLKNAAAGAEHE
jgi:hypothetical protein